MAFACNYSSAIRRSHKKITAGAYLILFTAEQQQRNVRLDRRDELFNYTLYDEDALFFVPSVGLVLRLHKLPKFRAKALCG